MYNYRNAGVVAPSLTKAQIQTFQRILKDRLCYDLGTSGPTRDGIDGVIGPSTTTAITRFQNAYNIENGRRVASGSQWVPGTIAITGHLDSDTRLALTNYVTRNFTQNCAPFNQTPATNPPVEIDLRTPPPPPPPPPPPGGRTNTNTNTNTNTTTPGNTPGGLAVNPGTQQPVAVPFLEQLFPPNNSVVQSLGGPTGTAVVAAATVVVVGLYIQKQRRKNAAKTSAPASLPAPVKTASNPNKKAKHRSK